MGIEEVDKAKVAFLAMNRNKVRRPNTQIGRQIATNPLYWSRQHQHMDWLIRNNNWQQEINLQETTQDDGGDAFGDAFQNVELSEAAHEGDQAI
jgi:hypothetical protein